MGLLETTPTPLKYIYKLLGIVQFPIDNPTTSLSKFSPRLWCIPFYCYFVYVCVEYTTSPHDIEGIFAYVDEMAAYTSFISMIVCMVSFYKRSNELRSLLTKVDEIEIYMVASATTKHLNWSRLVLLVIILLNMATFPFMQINISSSIYYFIPPMLNSLDHLFLDDILNSIGDKFELINQHFQRQVNSVDLFVIFPLTKAEKVKTLKEDEVTFNIQRIQELSHLHYNLVVLATKIVGIFEITTIVAMMMWFGYVIDTMYYIVYITLTETKDSVLMGYVFNIIYLVFCFFWLFVMVAMFSRTQNKANKTATYVHDIWNKYAMKNEIDRRVRHLQLIAIRLLNTKLQFTAKDFFSLDWTFYHMMIAAITTYVVILIQFNL